MSIHHDLETHRFTLTVASGTAVLAYTPAGADVLELYSTFVPPGDRGRGIAARLVEAAVGYARAEGFRLIPTCWYVARWMREHPEHADLLSS